MPTIHDQMLRKVLRNYSKLVKKHRLGSQYDKEKINIELPTFKGIMDIVDTCNCLIIEIKTEIFDISSHIRQLNQYSQVYNKFKKVLIYPKCHEPVIKEYDIMFKQANIVVVFLETKEMTVDKFDDFMEKFKDDGYRGRGRKIEI
jgi:hypothetical protein